MKTMAADRALEKIVAMLRQLGDVERDAVIHEAARRIETKRRMLLGGLLEERRAAAIVAAVVPEGLPGEDAA